MEKKLNIHIPNIDIHYWTLMILAITIGEIAGNLISRNLGLGYSTGSLLLISTFILSIIIIALSGKENANSYFAFISLENIFAKINSRNWFKQQIFLILVCYFNLNSIMV